jgi:hypothetical protein
MKQIVALLESDLDVLINLPQVSSTTPAIEGSLAEIYSNKHNLLILMCIVKKSAEQPLTVAVAELSIGGFV